MNWSRWIRRNWGALLRGRWLQAPSRLTHPSRAGFRRLAAAEPRGQVADWALSCDDGSRVHVHEHADGRLIAHRDQHDPDAGIGSAVLHVVKETAVGPLVVLGIVAAVGVGFIAAFSRK